MTTHLNHRNQAGMVDITHKQVTARTAVATASVRLGSEIAALFDGIDISSKKGPIFHTAIIAGITGAKRTSHLIPLCHPIPLEDCKITIDLVDLSAHIRCTTRTSAKTGVEMEALTGASVAALTLYDMCKSMNPHIVIEQIQLIEKSGGKSDIR